MIKLLQEKNSRRKGILFLTLMILILSVLPVYAKSVEQVKSGLVFSGPHFEFDMKVGMANPAAIYCSELGYTYKVVKTAQGERGICVFKENINDIDECDAWEFLNGKCGREYSYCARHGYDIETLSDGKNPFSQEYAVCVPKGFTALNIFPGANKPVTELMKLSEKTSSNINSDMNYEINEKRTHSTEIKPLDSVPTTFDWRDKDGQDWMTPIKDQEWCGSCWAFSTVGVVEAKYNIFENNANFDLDLSEENLVSDCHTYDEYQNCRGGYKTEALWYIQDEGITDEECFPYVSNSCWSVLDCVICTYPDACANSICSDRCPDWENRLWKIDGFNYVNSVLVKEYLIEKGPVSVSINMEGDWDENGIYRCDDDTTVNHGVIIAGYNDTGGYWIVKNSWGETWGENGYFRVGYNECAIENYVYYVDLIDLNRPIINHIQCNDGTDWLNCSDIGYDESIVAVRANCTAQSGYVANVSFRLKNIPDNHEFFDNEAAFESGWWIYNNSDVLIRDSGNWELLVRCIDNNSIQNLASDTWLVSWGHLESYLINPTSAKNVTRYNFFNFSSGVRCVGGECGDVTAVLDPIISGDSRCDVYDSSGYDEDYEYAIMRPDPETLEKWIGCYNKAQKISAGLEVKRDITESSGTFFSLLSHLNYNPVERNQRYCGNCWAWAGTGVMGISLDVQKGVFDRLSVQYINSCESEIIGKSCCDGGWLSDLADFYNSTEKTISWSNTNADWQDGDASCDTDCADISTTPDYSISYIDELTIPTHAVDKVTAIANIKNILNQNKAVWFAFFLPNSASWDDFRDFWRYDSESDVYNMDKFCGIPYAGGGGHAILCVGYNDTDANNSYWIMLNSWGTTAGRPNGIFYINMSMDYDCVNSPYYSFYWQTLDITFDIESNKGVIPMNNGTPFYTTDQNPRYSANLSCLQDMHDGDTCDQTWQVNATGELNSSWEFFTIYIPAATYSSYIPENETEKVNISIVSKQIASIFDIQLITGWNLISTPLEPENASNGAVLSGLNGRIVVTTYNTTSDEWYTYYSNSSETSTLDEIVAGRGYWLYSESGQNLTIHGYKTTEEINLYDGWNLVGYNSLIGRNMSTVLSSLNGTVTSYTYNTSSNTWIIYDSTGLSFLNTLTDIGPGKGYWLWSDVNQTWSI